VLVVTATYERQAAASVNGHNLQGLTVPEITDDMSTLDAALAYSAAGFYIGPCGRGTKDPGSILGGSWQRKTSRDPQMITAWFGGTDHGIFLHVGRSGAWVADVDNPDNLHAAIRQAIARPRPALPVDPPQPPRARPLPVPPTTWPNPGQQPRRPGRWLGRSPRDQWCDHRRPIGA
jgi:hypothetical protein